MNSGFDVAQMALLGEATDCLEDVAVFVWDEDRRYVAANRAACRLIDRTREQILEMRVGDLSPDRANEVFSEVQKRGVHAGVMDSPSGSIHYVTCKTRVAGLPYMVSICWRADA
jgi:PAS domain-containing protein